MLQSISTNKPDLITASHEPDNSEISLSTNASWKKWSRQFKFVFYRNYAF